MIHDEPPPELPDASTLRFDTEGPYKFHDLMHSIWRCDDRALHWSRAWEYRWGPDLRAATLCRLGHHKLVKCWRRRPNSGDTDWRFSWACAWCGREPALPDPGPTK